MNNKYRKCLCINNTHEYSMSQNIPLLIVGNFYEYYIINDSNYVRINDNAQLFLLNKRDHDKKFTTYFDDFFIDMEEYRYEQINKILNYA